MTCAVEADPAESARGVAEARGAAPLTTEATLRLLSELEEGRAVAELAGTVLDLNNKPAIATAISDSATSTQVNTRVDFFSGAPARPILVEAKPSAGWPAGPLDAFSTDST
jgi:phage-related baseplate assembly protein